MRVDLRSDEWLALSTLALALVAVGVAVATRRTAAPDSRIDVESPEPGFFEQLAEKERLALTQLADHGPGYDLIARVPVPSDGDLANAAIAIRARLSPAIARAERILIALGFVALVHAGAIAAAEGARVDDLPDDGVAVEALISLDAFEDRRLTELERDLPGQLEADAKEGGTGSPYNDPGPRCRREAEVPDRDCLPSPHPSHDEVMAYLHALNDKPSVGIEDELAIARAMGFPCFAGAPPCARERIHDLDAAIGEPHSRWFAEDLRILDPGLRPTIRFRGVAPATALALEARLGTAWLELETCRSALPAKNPMRSARRFELDHDQLRVKGYDPTACLDATLASVPLDDLALGALAGEIEVDLHGGTRETPTRSFDPIRSPLQSRPLETKR